MPISKVNENYQVTIPKAVREKAKIDKGDAILVEYDERENTVKLTPPKRGKRKTWKLGSRLTLADIESSIEKGRPEN